MKKCLLIILTLFVMLFVACQAPLVTYTVTFLDKDGEIIEEQQVLEGSAAMAPEPFEYNGLLFDKWDKDFSNVTSNLTVQALYKQARCTVTFLGKNGEVLKTQKVNNGNAAEAPELPEYPFCTFVKWDKDFSSVTEDMTVQAIYNQEKIVVTFLGKNGEVLDIQGVDKGDAALAPTPPSYPFFTFDKWDKDFSNITEDITIQALYIEDEESDFEMTDYRYWLKQVGAKYDISAIIMTKEEIEAYNQNILSDVVATEVVDVLKTGETVTKSYVLSLINAYNLMDRYTVYNDSTKSALSSTEKNAILENRNINAIPETVTVQYGLIVNFAWMRSYPTRHYSNSYTSDKFQETSLNVGEEVAVFHTSSDGNWKFIQARTYCGWVESKYIATSDYETVASFVNDTNRIVVIGNYVTILNAHVRMGQSFPLASETDKFIIKFPIRNTSGELVLQNVQVDKDENYHKGYLDYTYENLFKQAFKLLGIPYSWGDKVKEGRDCSSTQKEIYASFGIKLPRNGGNQNDIPTYGASTPGITINKLVSEYDPGTIIFSSGHVMMYIGVDEEGVAYIFHNTSAGNGECILQKLQSYGISKIIGTLRMQ